MTRTIILVATVCLLYSCCMAEKPAPAETPNNGTAAVVRGSNAFAADLYAKLAATEKGNLFFSPGSIDTALAMTYAGAGGDTAKQMASTLHFTLPADQLAPAFGKLLNTLNNPPKLPGGEETETSNATDGRFPRAYQLTIANALWGQKGYAFKPAFTELLKKNYGAAPSELDFAQTEQARKTINDWAAAQTKDKIKDLLPAGVLTDLTRLVLTNAVYFKSNWEMQFSKDATQEGEFRVSSGKMADSPLTHIVSVKVPMMRANKHYGYLENDDLQLLRLPYKLGELSMIVLLPKKADGIGAMEKKLTAAYLAELLKGDKSQSVEVSLPKFKFSSQFMLADVLKGMGMTDAFDANKANFSGITDKENLFISAVVHKAFIAVDEDGTEAAAATAVAIGVMSIPIQETPKVFNADHPFVFLIRHNSTGEILFMGRVMNPKGD